MSLMTAWSIIFLTIFGVVACDSLEKKQEKDTAKTPGPQGGNTTTGSGQAAGDGAGAEGTAKMFLDLGELKGEKNFKKISKADLVQEINSSYSYFADYQSDAPEYKGCTDDLGKTKAGKDFVSLEIEGDFKPCMLVLTEIKKNDLKESTFKYSLVIKASGGDLSDLGNLTLEEYSDKSANKSTDFPTSTHISNNETKSHMSVAGKEGNKVEVTVVTKKINSQPDGKPCELKTKDKLTTFSNCLKFTVTTTTVGDQDPTIDINSLLTKNLTFGKKDKYFRSGTIEFQYNNWKGKMTYTSPNTAPKWTASSEDGEKASGTYSFKK